MKKLAIVLVVATASAFALATSAKAHPLGNFTINRYSRIDVSGTSEVIHTELKSAIVMTG